MPTPAFDIYCNSQWWCVSFSYLFIMICYRYLFSSWQMCTMKETESLLHNLPYQCSNTVPYFRNGHQDRLTGCCFTNDMYMSCRTKMCKQTFNFFYHSKIPHISVSLNTYVSLSNQSRSPWSYLTVATMQSVLRKSMVYKVYP